MPGPVTDPRAGEVLRHYRELFGGAELPLPVESIAEDLLGLRVAEADDLVVSGLLLPKEREVWINSATGSVRSSGVIPPRSTAARRTSAPMATASSSARRTFFAAELLMPEPVVRDEFPRADSIADMAARFSVPGEAMQWRLYNFALAPHPQEVE